MDIHDDQCYSHTGYDIISCFRSPFIEVRKTTENASSDSFGSNFSGAPFCLVRITNWWTFVTLSNYSQFSVTTNRADVAGNISSRVTRPFIYRNVLHNKRNDPFRATATLNRLTASTFSSTPQVCNNKLPLQLQYGATTMRSRQCGATIKMGPFIRMHIQSNVMKMKVIFR